VKYQDEFRTTTAIQPLLDRIAAEVTQPWNIMEICGGQTHAIMKYGIDRLLPQQISLLHGPGCPVCVTPQTTIDQALAIASLPGVIFCSYGDMAKVPGSEKDLLMLKAEGADIRLVYATSEALALARAHPDKEVVFFAVGFETTAPATAIAVSQAAAEGLDNFSVLCAHVLVPPAIEHLLNARDHRINGFLAAGHVCTITGEAAYRELAHQYGIPMVITGFEPVDILLGVHRCVAQLEAGMAEMMNSYRRVVREAGNPHALALIDKVFRVEEREWRGMGSIPASGWGLAPAYARFDATEKFTVSPTPSRGPGICISGDVLQGKKKPSECPAFGTTCTPDKPLGATMVSNEGACAAYYHYRPAETEEAVRDV